MANLIRMLKKAGAVSVHVRVSSPPFLYPCYFGTDIPSNKQLIASSHTADEIREIIGWLYEIRRLAVNGRRTANLQGMS